MSKTTMAIESAVEAVLAQVPAGEAPLTARQRHNVDKAFAEIMKLIAPRVRHFIRQYGLAGHWEDAEQACAIAVHRAIQSYDRDKAQFTTFVNWQIRGELQSLRFRLMTDQRSSARKVEATTISLNALKSEEGEESAMQMMLEDENALALTEAGASDYLAGSAMRELMDGYVDHLRKTAISQLSRRARPRQNLALVSAKDNRPRLKVLAIDPEELHRMEQRLSRNRALVEQRLFELDGGTPNEEDQGITKERMRQITKRAVKTISEITDSDPKFLIMRDASRKGTRAVRAKDGSAVASASQPCPLPIGHVIDRVRIAPKQHAPKNYNSHKEIIINEMPGRNPSPGMSIH